MPCSAAIRSAGAGRSGTLGAKTDRAVNPGLNVRRIRGTDATEASAERLPVDPPPIRVPATEEAAHGKVSVVVFAGLEFSERTCRTWLEA